MKGVILLKKIIFLVLFILVFTTCMFPLSLGVEAKQVTPMWSLMAYGDCSIAQISSGFVEITGETQAFSSYDIVKVTLKLQQYKNSQWNTVQTVTFTEYDSDYVYGFRQYFVETGYNYRTVADHYVKEGITVETTQSYTNGMYID